MSKVLGFIKLYRAAQERYIFTKNFIVFGCWCDLLLLAEFTDGNIVYHRGIRIELKRGQLMITIEELTRRWGLDSDKRTRSILTKLEKEESIRRPSGKLPIIEIVNYSFYQGLIDEEDEKGHSKMTKKGIQNQPLSNEQSVSYESDILKKGIQNQEKRAFKIEKEKNQKNKEDIKEIRTTTTAPAYAYEENLFALLAQDSVWLEAMAMNFCSELPTKDEQLQALYDAIRELRKQYYLDGKHHESVSDLKQHLRLSIKSIKRIKESESNGTSNKQHPPGGESKSERRRPTPPSHNFTESF